jgi:Arc/MetJ-type ribon-helix-helix transcriptional regulator
MAEKQKIKKEEAKKEQDKKPALNEFGDHMEKFAVKTAESIRKVIDRALSSRNTVLTIRVNDECNKKLNMLVESGLFRSRSESAAFLIEEGLKTQDPLFAKISIKFEKIGKLKTELKDLVKDEFIKTPKK